VLARLTRIVGSLAAVISTYLVYNFTVAALIVPPVSAMSGGVAQPVPGDLSPGQSGRLARFFAPNDWERTSNPIVLETKQGMMLLERYKQMPGGGVLLEPFSMVFLPTDTSGDQQERDRRAFVLRAPEGALLRFDGPVDLKRGKIGKLIGGQLRGKITIHSQQRSPGPEDDVRIVASEVQLNESHIWTPKPVGFQMGPNHGDGRELRIELIKEPDEAENLHGPNIGGIRSFELAHDVSLWLVLDTVDLGVNAAQPPEVAAPVPKEPEPPVEVTCRGPFRFDVENHVATFEDEVNVVRMHAIGPSDNLSCELLSLFFEPRDDPAAAGAPRTSKRSIPKLVPRRLEARGSPVVMRAPSQEVEARGQFLLYDLRTRGGTIWVSDQSAQDAWVRREGEEIHGRQLYFESDGSDDRRGRFEAIGPGWLTGAPPDDPDGRITAHWTGGAKFRPLDGLLVASLEGAVEGDARGRVRVDLPKQGHHEAEEIHIWLEEPAEPTTPGNKKPPPRPDRMLARGNVVIDSPQLTGRVDAIEVWFDNPPAAAAVKRHPETVAVADPPPREMTTARPSADRVAVQPAALPISDNRLSAAPQTPVKPIQRFDISGRRLRLRVSLAGEEPEVTEALVEDGVRLVQTQVARPEDKPLLVTGDHVHLVQPTPETGVVTVHGTDTQPAHVEARGLTLDGQVIHLDRGANRLRIDSPGRMTYPIDRDLEGNLLDQVRPLAITWQERMEFDGRQAVFYGDVVARESRQLMRAGRLEVNLSEKLSFQQSPEQQQQQPDIQSVTCDGQVYLERYAYEQDQLDAIQRMQAYDLTMNQHTGLLNATGPGWMKVVRVDTGDPFQTVPGATESSQVRPVAAGDINSDIDDEQKLSFLGVEFENRVIGNVNQQLRQRQMTFYGHVRSTYGEVQDWHDELSPDDLELLGPRGATLSCRELTVAEGVKNAEGKTQVELIAGGNVRVEGTKFTALASRMTYDQNKDLLVLEGDGRAPAELYHREQIGARDEYTLARKISYWRTTGYVHWDGVRGLDVDLTQMPRLDRPGPRAPGDAR